VYKKLLNGFPVEEIAQPQNVVGSSMKIILENNRML
jgi:hypothetical protein